MKNIETPLKLPSIGFKELRENADAIIAQVEQGQSFVVKRHSKPLFRIVPLDEEVWNTVIDFGEIDPHGVSIDDVLAAMEELKREQPEKYGRQNKKVSRAA